MARWARIITSASNAEVTSITASEMGAVTNDSAVVFHRSSPNEKILATSSLYFKTTNGGQLYFDNLGLAATELFISGVADGISNNSQPVFYNVDTTALSRTSSLFYNSSTNTLEFLGTFSGSFTGDGSGLTGVVGTMEYPLVNGAGIVSASATDLDFSYDGTTEVQIQVYTASNGGLTFEGGGLRLTESLAGDGLAWQQQYSQLVVGQGPGITVTAGGIRLANGVAGDGLSYTGGTLDVKINASGGLYLPSDRLALSSSLAGEGLRWANNYWKLEVDPDYVVTSSNVISFRTGSNNLTLTATNATPISDGYTANLIDEPTFTYDVSDNLVGNFTINGNFTLTGTTTIFSGSQINFGGKVQSNHPFLILNSGSSTGDGGFAVQTSTGGGAYLFFDYQANRWGVSKDNFTFPVNSHSVTGSNRAAINTVRVTTDTEATIISSTPVFGHTDDTRVGQVVVKSNQSANESPLFIYA